MAVATLQRRIGRIAVMAFLAFACNVQAQTSIHVGCMNLTVSDSWTAQVFHIVDQLSGWDPYLHKQYVRWASKSLILDQDDKRALDHHAALRRGRGWGKGFEQAFLVDATIDEAAKRAALSGTLTPEEAAAERSILRHFADRLLPLRTAGTPRLAAFQARLTRETSRIGSVIQQLCRFSDAPARVDVPVFLVINPEEGSGGGEANGDRIVVEVQNNPDPMQFLLHESLHALLNPHADSIRAVAGRNAMTWTTLNEGIAYALSPGITDDPRSEDTLIEQWVRALRAGRAATDNFIQIYMLAAVIRPVLRSSLASGETFSTFLPRAMEHWKRAIE